MKFKIEEDNTGLFQHNLEYSMVRYASANFQVFVRVKGTAFQTLHEFPSDCRFSFDDTYIWLYKPAGLLTHSETLLFLGKLI